MGTRGAGRAWAGKAARVRAVAAWGRIRVDREGQLQGSGGGTAVHPVQSLVHARPVAGDAYTLCKGVYRVQRQALP